MTTDKKTEAHNQGERDAANGRSRRILLLKPFESESDYQERVRSYNEGFEHARGQKDAAEGRCPHSPWGKPFESDENFSSRNRSYKAGYSGSGKSRPAAPSPSNDARRETGGEPSAASKASEGKTSESTGTSGRTIGGGRGSGGVGGGLAATVVIGIIIATLVGALWTKPHTPPTTPTPDNARQILWPGNRPSDAKPMSQPPKQLVEVDKCLLYKCGGERLKALEDTAIMAGPSLTANQIGLIKANTIVEPIDAAWVTNTPNVIRYRKSVEVSLNPTYYVQQGDLVYEYASWEGGCVTAWAKGFLGNMCPVADHSAFENIRQGKASVWYKVNIGNGLQGWVRRHGDIGWIRNGEPPNFQQVE